MIEEREREKKEGREWEIERKKEGERERLRGSERIKEREREGSIMFYNEKENAESQSWSLNLHSMPPESKEPPLFCKCNKRIIKILNLEVVHVYSWIESNMFMIMLKEKVYIQSLVWSLIFPEQ